ncbi:hypothetical protein CRG98_019178 [Punica granatum]|uniref:Uncharacterized protein n=1 Tax=Punica granatum TaxID=22663 RepID=A0A2I0JVV0_PUNGR|nr:hypothetical protein CRG98_019178 [Punica granatum]
MAPPSAFQKPPAKAGALSNSHRRLLDGAPGTPDPQTSKRHPETGLHTPKDHQDHGIGFRLRFGVHLGLPSGSRPGKRGSFLQKDIAGDPFNKSPVHEICTNQSQGPQGLGR